MFSHSGWVPGYRTDLGYMPSLDLTVGSLANVSFDYSCNQENRDAIRKELAHSEDPEEKQRQYTQIFEARYPEVLPILEKHDLCDQIQENHPQYKRAIIEQAHLIFGNANLSSDDRFEKAMLVLIKLPHDKDAKAFRRTFLEQYWSAEVGGELPKVLIDPQNREQFTDLKSYIQDQKREKQKQSATTLL